MFFASIRGSWPQFMVPKGGKEAKALLMAFLYLLSIIVQPDIENSNGNNLPNYQKQPILNQERNLYNNN